MSLRGDVLHSLKWLAGARFAGQLVAWAITLVVIRILKPSDYGLMAISEAIVGFAALFREMGLYSAMVQKRDLTASQVEQSFGLLILVNCVIYAVVFATAPLLADYFGDPRLTPMVRVMGIQFPLAAVGVVQDAMLSRQMKFKPKSFVNLAASLGNGFTTLPLALLGAGVWALVFGNVAGSLIRAAGLVMAARYWCWPRFSRKGMGDMLRFGGFVTASKLCWYVYSHADVFIIGKVLGSKLLGFYSIAMQLASLPMQKVAELLGQVGYAAYASIQHDMDVLRSNFLKAVRVLGVVSFPVFWGIVSIAPELVSVVLGEKWQRAVVPIELLGLIMPLRMIGQAEASVLAAIGKPHLSTLYQFVALLLMPPAFFLGAYFGGLDGAALAWVAVYPILMLIRLRIGLPSLGVTFRQYFSAIAMPAAAGALMLLAVIAARTTIAESSLAPLPGLIFLIAVGAVVYSGFIWLVDREKCLEIIDLVRPQR
ncbi:MAG TPA: lipopolysaccharide biosynthesis protein [Rhodanobacteraceae bacterium]